MAPITYHQTLITFVLFFPNMRQIQLRIHINNKKKTPDDDSQSGVFFLYSFTHNFKSSTWMKDIFPLQVLPYSRFRQPLSPDDNADRQCHRRQTHPALSYEDCRLL